MKGEGVKSQHDCSLDAAVGASDYTAGDRFTVTDVDDGSQVICGTQFNTLLPCNNSAAYASRLRKRPAYLGAKAIEQASMPWQASAHPHYCWVANRRASDSAGA